MLFRSETYEPLLCRSISEETLRPASAATSARSSPSYTTGTTTSAEEATELSTGDTSAALAAAERSVAVDRYGDEGWRLLIQAHERDGDLGAASRARKRYAEMLVELGVDPAAQSPTLALPTPTTRTVAGT